MSGFHSCNPLISIPTPQFFALVAVGSNVLEIVVPLFQYAGDLGDANAFYTYAQLLRTGKAHRHTHMYVHTPPVTRTPTHLLPSGQGCAPNASRAAEIFTELAMKGHPYAQVAMGSVTNFAISTPSICVFTSTIRGSCHRLCVLWVLFPLL